MNRGLKKRLEARVRPARGSSIVVEFDPKVYYIDDLPPPEPRPRFAPPTETIVVTFVEPRRAKDNTP